MDYEKKYKEALERAKDMLAYKEVSQEDMEYLFPELEESKDEMIKQCLIEHIKCNKDLNWSLFQWFKPDTIISWLEKQGEKKNTRKREIDDAYLQGVCDTKHEIEKQAKKLDTDNVWLQNYLSNVICFVNQFKKDFGL